MKSVLFYLMVMVGGFALFAASGLPQIGAAPDPAPTAVAVEVPQWALATAAPPLEIMPPALPTLSPHNIVFEIQYRPLQGRLNYCYVVGDWTPYRETMRRAFASWEGSGVVFTEVELSGCNVHLRLTYDPQSPYAGSATIGPGFGLSVPGHLTMNTYYGFDPLVAAHEIGHILGLDHWDTGVMASPPEGWPGPAEWTAVSELWETQ